MLQVICFIKTVIRSSIILTTLSRQYVCDDDVALPMFCTVHVIGMVSPVVQLDDVMIAVTVRSGGGVKATYI